jgi:hypothetical protein
MSVSDTLRCQSGLAITLVPNQVEHAGPMVLAVIGQEPRYPVNLTVDEARFLADRLKLAAAEAEVLGRSQYRPGSYVLWRTQCDERWRRVVAHAAECQNCRLSLGAFIPACDAGRAAYEEWTILVARRESYTPAEAAR